MTQARDKTAAELAALCVRAGLPKPERERLVCEGRKWRWDLFWPWTHVDPVAVEIMGSTWTQGRHTRGAGYREDCRKANCGVLQGVRVLRMTTEDCVDGTALEEIAQALGRTLPAKPRNRAPAARARPSKQSGSSRPKRARAKLRGAPFADFPGNGKPPPYSIVGLDLSKLPASIQRAAARAARGRAP